MAKKYLFSSDPGVTKNQFIQEAVATICESLEYVSEDDFVCDSTVVAELMRHAEDAGYGISGQIYTIKESKLDLEAELRSDEWLPRLRKAIHAIEDEQQAEAVRSVRYLRKQKIENYRRLYEEFEGKPPEELE